ncbi:lipase family protein [Methylomarinum sp. Ch1-1]|uniref:Lipase family protein n=1 Tax=Methylomarinum roseum TaxID=3067653 RepID=A0AAU7NVJ6_9GAMM|nr:lipase family protein [Methylomarinum sp. Ch1-1]MDP4523029.1 lipase family protein [Methylomarinum sp. Ch1-1]
MQQNFTRDALYFPEKLPVFNEHDDSWEFDGEATTLSFANAWWLCNLSHLAYYDEHDSLAILHNMELTLEAFIDDRKEADGREKLIQDTQAYIISTDNAVILTFRGTEPDRYQDMLAEAYLQPVKFPGKGKVHGGFFGALSGHSWERIVSILSLPTLKSKPLWITGHSLGAALATIAAAHLNPHGLYTFASPRVGDSAFCASLKTANSQRFVNCSDLVARLPLKDITDYRHIGTLQYFNAAGDWCEAPGAAFMRRDSLKAQLLYPFNQLPIPFFTDKVAFRSLADHSILNYRYAIWKKLQKNRRLPLEKH